MEFREGTDVLTASGEKLGEVERVVIDPRTREVTHIVVKKGFLFTEDRVLPIEVVDSADGEQVVLSQNVGDDLEAWPVFEETYTIPIDQMPNTDTLGPPGETARTVSARPAPAYYWYPPAGVGYPGGSLGLPYYPPQVVHVERNVPSGSAALKEGAAIHSADDEHVGDVERVFTDSESDAITHLLISRGLLFKSHKLIPANWISDASDDEVFLSVDRAVLERLPDYEGD